MSNSTDSDSPSLPTNGTTNGTSGNLWSFGSFGLCQRVPYPICDMLAVEKQCTVKPLVGISNIAEFATCFVAISMIIYFFLMCRRKKAAVGRMEMIVFLTWYLLSIIFELVLGGIGVGGNVGKIIGALQVGSATASIIALFLNGFVGYQLLEDGTSLSMLGIIGSSLLYGIATAYLAADASYQINFKVTTNDPVNIPLYIIYFIVPLACLVLYVIAMVSLVFKYLQSRRQLGLLVGAFLAFVLSQFFGVFSNVELCKASNGRVDGRFLVTFWILVAVWWVYRFWDSITEDAVDEPTPA